MLLNDFALFACNNEPNLPYLETILRLLPHPSGGDSEAILHDPLVRLVSIPNSSSSTYCHQLLCSHCFHLILTLCIAMQGLSADTHEPFVLNSAHRLGQSIINFFWLFVFRRILAQSRGELIIIASATTIDTSLRSHMASLLPYISVLVGKTFFVLRIS